MISQIVVPMLLAATPASVDAVSPAEAQTSADGGTLAQQHPVAAPATADEGAEQPQEAAPSPAANAPGEPPAAAPAGTPPPKDIVVTGRLSSPADPVEKLNAVSYEAVQAVDEAFVGPVAHAYKFAVPEPVRDGLHNALDNLDEPIVFINFILQLKFGKAIETLGRFAINSTIGVAGLFDVAKDKPFNLPRRSNGLADTLGYYGVGPGPYLFLPIIGSTTVRDLIARPFDLAILPTVVGKPFSDPKVALGKGVLSAIDERQQNDDKTKAIRAAPDPYVAQREEYLARRRAEIEVLQGKRKSIYDPPYYTIPGPVSGDAVTTPEPTSQTPPTAPQPLTEPAPAVDAQPQTVEP